MPYDRSLLTLTHTSEHTHTFTHKCIRTYTHVYCTCITHILRGKPQHAHNLPGNNARTWHLDDVQVVIKVDTNSALKSPLPPTAATASAAAPPPQPQGGSSLYISGTAAIIRPPALIVGGESRIEVFAPHRGGHGVRVLTPAERERQRIVAHLMVSVYAGCVCVCVRVWCVCVCGCSPIVDATLISCAWVGGWVGVDVCGLLST